MVLLLELYEKPSSDKIPEDRKALLSLMSMAGAVDVYIVKQIVTTIM